jgi:hypothetical protein
MELAAKVGALEQEHRGVESERVGRVDANACAPDLVLVT